MPFPAGFLYLVMVCLIAGVVLWAVSALPALDATVKQFIRVIIIVLLAIYVIYFLFSIFAGAPMFHYR